MDLYQQVVSLDLAKRLKELNVKQQSLFYWGYYQEPVDENPSTPKIYLHNDPRRCEENHHYSAFTVAELGELLPPEVWYGKLLQADEKGIERHAGYGIWYDHDSGVVASFDADTEADTRAKMLIYLIKNNLL